MSERVRERRTPMVAHVLVVGHVVAEQRTRGLKAGGAAGASQLVKRGCGMLGRKARRDAGLKYGGALPVTGRR